MLTYKEFKSQVAERLQPHRTSTDMHVRCTRISQLFRAFTNWPHSDDLVQLQTDLKNAHDQLVTLGENKAATTVLQIAEDLQTNCTATTPA